MATEIRLVLHLQGDGHCFLVLLVAMPPCKCTRCPVLVFYGFYVYYCHYRKKVVSGQNTAIKSGSFLYGIRNYGGIKGFKICFDCFMEL